MRVVIALDKFRGTATAAEATAAVGHACWELGFDADEVPVSDGGEGLIDVLGGANRTSIVTGPLGAAVSAGWRLEHRTAVIEMAAASGLALAGGAEGNDPMLASTIGTGELIDRAFEQGARSVIVGLGGSATTDGGLGAIEALRSPSRIRSSDVRVACDVRTRFLDAAAVFAPQKGASAAQVGLLTARLEQLARRYEADYGVDVTEIPGGGAAGGLAGGLAALGARLVGGFELVAEQLELEERIATADVVVTGEGHLDAQSLEGKVVGGVCELAADRGRPVLVIVGGADDDVAAELDARPGISVVSLVERYGDVRARDEPRWCIERAAADALARCSSVAPTAQPATVVVVVPPATAGGVTVAPAAWRSASVLFAVSVPIITSTVAVPRSPWIGGGVGSASVVSATHVGGDRGGHGLGRRIGRVVHDRRVELRTRRVRRLAGQVAGGLQRLRHRRRRATDATGVRNDDRRRLLVDGRRGGVTGWHCLVDARDERVDRAAVDRGRVRRDGHAVVVVLRDLAQDEEAGDDRDDRQHDAERRADGRPRIADALPAGCPALGRRACRPLGCVGHALPSLCRTWAVVGCVEVFTCAQRTIEDANPT